MKPLAEVLLICYCYSSLVSFSRSSEYVASTLKAETPLMTTSASTSTSLATSTNIATKVATGDNVTVTTTTSTEEVPKPRQLPVDLLSPDKVLLDPNVVLARIARDTYGGWGPQRQSFGNSYERPPFGIQGFYNRPYNRDDRTERPRRRNSDVRRFQATPRPFRVYPVFPG